MSHRRKSARPTNKLRRTTDTSSVSSDSDADHTKMLIEEYASSRDEVDTHDGACLPASSSPQLLMPPDLWQDFQALRAATNLDTASLMRRLIQDYGRSSQSTASSPQPAEAGPESCIANNDDSQMEYQTPSDPQNDDVLILDLSRSAKATPDSSATAGDDLERGYQGNEYFEDGDRDGPLDLTMCRDKQTMRGPDRDEYGEMRAPEAHKSQSEGSFLFAASPSVPFLSGNYTNAAAQPRAAHTATSQSQGSRATHGHHADTGSSRVPSAVSHNPNKFPANRPASADQNSGDADAHVTSRAAHVSRVAGHQAVLQGHVDVNKANNAGSFLHAERSQRADPQCVTFPVLSSSTPSILRHHLDSSESSSTPGPMQLPTVTSLEFISDPPKDGSHPPGERGVYSVQMKMPTSSEASILSAALPATTASAILLDPASGGLVAASGGLVSAVNIPLMTTTTGGLVAIPFLHALPESLAAAAPQAPAQGQPQGQAQPQSSPPNSTSPTSAPPTTYPNSAPTSTSSSKSIRPKLGRPRGQGKAQKQPPKDMKLVTENTLFPGVYTSILKLPWSKRARGKSTKSKNAAAQPPTSSAAAAAACAASTNCVESYSAAQTMNAAVDGATSQGGQTKEAMALPVHVLSMPMLVSDQQPPASSAATSTASTSSSVSVSSSESVMMVYPSGTVSTLGKPVRRRGRPPKLPMLSHLLADKSHRVEESVFPEQHQERKMDTSHSQPAMSTSNSQIMPPQTTNSVADSKPEPMDVTEPEVKRCSDGAGAGCGAVDGGVVGVVGDGGVEKLEGASLETRFNILANQLGLEIGSSYHASLVQATPSEQHAADAALYQEMLLSSRSLVEVKPRRRQLNDLIKPSDDCVYTSFRITPRFGGRGGKTVSRALAKKRAAQLERAAAARAQMDGEKTVSRALERRRAAQMDRDSGVLVDGGSMEMCQYEDGDFQVKGAGGYDEKGVVCFVDRMQCPGSLGGNGSAVITERIPGAGDVPLARLYQDLYHCKLCNEMLPADDTVEHRCGASVSPSLRSCDSCGTMFSVRDPSVEHSGQALLCQRCVSKRTHGSPPPAASSTPQDSDQTASDAFACLPCGVRFVAIADYIEHRRSAHLDKLSRQPRKTHTLKTQVCPAQACPRLFHTQAELARHVREEHNHDMTDSEREHALSVCGIKQEAQTEGSPEVGDSQHDPEELSSSEETKAQYVCTQDGCGKVFHQPIDLLEHVQASHEGVTEWQCPMNGCTRVFAAERHLRVHLLMHKEEKPLKCKFCNYRCRQKNALNWHMRKHPESANHYRKFAGLSADV